MKKVTQTPEPAEPASPSKVVLLSNLAGEIRTAIGHSPTYHQLWKLVVDGVLPAEKVGHRYKVDVQTAIETIHAGAVA
jgi:hypothetical protein